MPGFMGELSSNRFSQRLLYELGQRASSFNIALRTIDNRIEKLTPIKLLSCSLQGDAKFILLGPVTFKMDLPIQAEFPLSMTQPSQFSYFGDRTASFAWQETPPSGSDPLLVDPRTGVVNKFPASLVVGCNIQHGSISIQMLDFVQDELKSFRTHSPWKRTLFDLVCFSATHVIVVYRYPGHYPSQDSEKTFIKAFALDTSHTFGGTAELRVTHEGIVEDLPLPIQQMRGADICPATGSITLRFLGCQFESYTRVGLGDLVVGEKTSRYLCVDVRVPSTNPESREITTVFADTKELFAFPGAERAFFLQISDDGRGRGFAVVNVQPHCVATYKFSIDASGEKCIAEWIASCQGTSLSAPKLFDGVTGRTCWSTCQWISTDSQEVDVVVQDLR